MQNIYCLFAFHRLHVGYFTVRAPLDIRLNFADWSASSPSIASRAAVPPTQVPFSPPFIDFQICFSVMLNLSPAYRAHDIAVCTTVLSPLPVLLLLGLENVQSKSNIPAPLLDADSGDSVGR